MIKVPCYDPPLTQYIIVSLSTSFIACVQTELLKYLAHVSRRSQWTAENLFCLRKPRDCTQCLVLPCSKPTLQMTFPSWQTFAAGSYFSSSFMSCQFVCIYTAAPSVCLHLSPKSALLHILIFFPGGMRYVHEGRVAVIRTFSEGLILATFSQPCPFTSPLLLLWFWVASFVYCLEPAMPEEETLTSCSANQFLRNKLVSLVATVNHKWKLSIWVKT